MRAGILLDGTPPSPDVAGHLDACDVLICADGAANWLRDMGRAPDTIIGDLDSIDPEVLARDRDEGTEVAAYPRDKDQTDGELALALAIERKATEVSFFGATGGRTAMVLANLKLLRQARDAGLDATLLADGERIRYLQAGDEWGLGAFRGGLLSIMALMGPATVAMPGTGWPDRTTLPADSVRGVSNPIRTYDAKLQVFEGAVLAVAEFSR